MALYHYTNQARWHKKMKSNIINAISCHRHQYSRVESTKQSLYSLKCRKDSSPCKACIIPLLKHYAKCHKAESKQSNGLHKHRLDSNVFELQITTIKVNHLAFTPSEQTALTNYGRALVFP